MGKVSASTRPFVDTVDAGTWEVVESAVVAN